MTDIGQLQAGVAYAFDMDKPKHKKIADRLLAKKLAAKTTQEALDLEAKNLAERQRADQAGSADGVTVAPALAVMAEQAAKKVLQDAAEQAHQDAEQVLVDAKAAAEVEASKIVAEAKKEAARIVREASKGPAK